jgi:hypothetical protein
LERNRLILCIRENDEKVSNGLGSNEVAKAIAWLLFTRDADENSAILDK